MKTYQQVVDMAPQIHNVLCASKNRITGLNQTPRVGKGGAGPCGPFGVRASRSANPIASRRAHPANASPLLRAFQPVTCRFSMLLWLGEDSPRPPLPKADPKHSRMRNALSAAGRRGARGGMVMEPFCQPSEFPKKEDHSTWQKERISTLPFAFKGVI